MAWIRLSDDYNDHPKFDNLSDGAFRLWHQALGFCRKFQTDGHIPTASVRKFKAYSSKRQQELMTPWQTDAAPLWDDIPGVGVRVHDYLDWNLSKAEETKEREAAAARMRRLRAPSSGVRSPEHIGERSPDVPGREGNGASGSEEKTVANSRRPFPREHLISAPDPDVLLDRAARLLERYAELFYLHRRGARYHNRMHLDYEKAQQLVRTWADDARLEKLAVLILTTDDDWISRTDRGFAIFALKATWADDRLKEWELDNGVAS